MGLSISRSLVEANEGVLRFNSKPKRHYFLFHLTGKEKNQMSGNKPDTFVYLVDDDLPCVIANALIESTGQMSEFCISGLF